LLPSIKRANSVLTLNFLTLNFLTLNFQKSSQIPRFRSTESPAVSDPMEFQLTQRQERVLFATIRHYISTAEPVGSKVLVEEYQLDASPATVRNAMGALEKAGLLYQPHTSAGRVPSDSGYRVYVDRCAMPSEQMVQRTNQLLSHQLKASSPHLDLLLKGAAQLLAGLSGCIAAIALPQLQTLQVRHVRLLPIEADRVMLLVVTDDYQSHSAIVPLPQTDEAASRLDTETLERELVILSNFLDEQLRDRSLLEVTQLDWDELGREFDRRGQALQEALVYLARRAQPPTTTRIVISGVSEVLRQPEFSELQQVQTLIHLLEEEQERLWSLIFEDAIDDQRVRIRIGMENPWEPIQGYTLISSLYGNGVSPLGSVGILGPTRLDYDRAIAAVGATADYLSEVMGASGSELPAGRFNPAAIGDPDSATLADS
jgi:heat-inducible transcriptional repressor